jgi:hypothetical protein
VGLYNRGIERYALDSFKKYLKRDWDGVYIDWHGAHMIALHESKNKPDPAFDDPHFSSDGSCLPAREYFLYIKKLRSVVGPKGFLIGHQAIGNTGILSNLAMDAYLCGEARVDHDMLKDTDTAVYKGMLGGGVCMPWPIDSPDMCTSPEGIAKMAALGLYPHAILAYQRPGKKTLYPADPDAPANAWVLPYWRVLAAVDAERCTVYNSAAVNLVAATSSNASVSCLVYKEAGKQPGEDAYLIVAANLGQKPTSAAIVLEPKVLGMAGTYAVSRVDSQTGEMSPSGTATTTLTTGDLAPWQIEGMKLTPTAHVSE